MFLILDSTDGRTKTTQLNKIQEEWYELKEEINRKEPDEEKIVDEAMDLITATFNYIGLTSNPSLFINKHTEKMKNRHPEHKDWLILKEE